MRKNLNLKLSWYTPENWDKLIEDGYLPVLAIESPEIFYGTPIHFPELMPHEISLEEYQSYLERRIVSWKIINTFNVLFHVSCAPKGIVILTSKEDDRYRGVLGKYLGRYLETEPTEYEYS